MGRRFFSQQFPLLIEALQKIAMAQEQMQAQRQTTRAAGQELFGLPDTETDILAQLYNIDYMPESMKRRENDPLNKEVHQTMSALLETLSPSQREFFLAYEGAENTRGNSIACRAYKDGVRLAVQVIMAGCTVPIHTEPTAQPDGHPAAVAPITKTKNEDIDNG